MQQEIISCSKISFPVQRNYFFLQEIIVSCLKLLTYSIDDSQWLSSISYNKKYTSYDK